MSENMDAEIVCDNINILWREVDAVITEYNGIIDKHIGDAVNLASRLEHAALLTGY